MYISLVLSYFILNLILSLISMILVERADEYWRRNEDAPMNLLTRLMIISFLNVIEVVASSLGYCHSLYAILTKKEPPKTKKTYLIIVKILSAVVKLLLFIPITVYTIIREIYFNIKTR